MQEYRVSGSASSVGEGQVQVFLSVPAIGWGEPLQGAVRVTGGRERLLPASIDARLVAINSGGSGPTTYAVQAQFSIARDVTLEAGETRDVPFSHRLPDEVRDNDGIGSPIARGLMGAMDSLTSPTRKWRVEVAVHSAAVNGAANCGFSIAPAAFIRVADLIRETSGLWGSSDWSADMGWEAGSVFLPHGEQAKVYDGVYLQLKREAETVIGQITINPQEHSVGDKLKSLVLMDRLRFPIRFRQDDFGDARRQVEEVFAGFRESRPTPPG